MIHYARVVFPSFFDYMLTKLIAFCGSNKYGMPLVLKSVILLKKKLSGKSKLFDIVNRIFFNGFLPRILKANDVSFVQSNDPEPNIFFVFDEIVISKC